MRVTLKSLAIVTLAALVLAGCGRKGPLEPPGGSPAAEAAPTSLIGLTAPRQAPEPEKQPDEPFILDPLI